MMKHDVLFSKRLLTTLLFSVLFALPIAGIAAEEVKTEAETKPAASAPAPAGDEKPTGEATMAALNRYIWRGYELSRNSVVIQPSLTVGYRGFSANLWGNLDTKPYFAGIGDSPYTSTMNETDLALSYTKTLGWFNVGGGYIYYALAPLNKDLPKRADIHELFLTVGLNTPLSPTLTVYRDIDHYRNWYLLLGLSHTYEFNKVVSLKLEATASYLASTYADGALFNAGAGYGGYPGFDGNAQATSDKFNNFHDGKVAISLPIKATKRITLTPSIACIFPLSADARYEMKGQGMKGGATAGDRDSSFIVGSLTAGFAF